MKLVLIDENNYQVKDYGEISQEEVEAFFTNGIEAIKFRESFSELMIRNEVQMRLVTDTLAKMGLVHGDPEAIEAFFRPYIGNEFIRQANRRNLVQRINAKLSGYREHAWHWVKAEVFDGFARLLARITNRFTGKK